MFLLSLIALLLLGCSVALVARGLALPRLKVAERIRDIDRYGFNSAAPVEAVAATQSGPALGELAGRIGGLVAGRLKSFRPDELRRMLVSAGLYKVTPAALLGYRVLLGTVIGISGAMWASGRGAGFAIAGGAFCAFLGWMTPLIFVRRLARTRLESIDLELPDLIDLLVVTVEAGSGLASSLALATSKLEGPLAQELRITLQEQRMGRSLPDALQGMLVRADTPNMRSFVRSIVQGEVLGVSIGTIMRNLAGEMRSRRRSAAQERAQKAPVKMLFPLVFMILPAFIVTILGPAMFELAGGLT